MSQFYKQIRVVLKTNKQTNKQTSSVEAGTHGQGPDLGTRAGFVPASRRDGAEAACDGPGAAAGDAGVCWGRSLRCDSPGDAPWLRQKRIQTHLGSVR